MKNWENVKKLHIEISSQCNAVCPMCTRYPTASYFEHPHIQKDWMWTIDAVKQRLPKEDLTSITSYLINGTVGDFIMNSDAIEIIQYLSSSSPQANISINTNGSARTSAWWTTLAKIPNVVVNFAIDGLEDTHSLYRRNTSWSKIINNAKTFIEAGGNANWTMIVFEHNKHQVTECVDFSKTIGFKTFSRQDSDRLNTDVINKDGLLGYGIRSADPIITFYRDYDKLRYKEDKLKNGTFYAKQKQHTKALPSLDSCMSISEGSVYIGSNWAVMPCCFYGAITIGKQTDDRWGNFLRAITEAGFALTDFNATNTKTVRQVFEQGFDWIYDRILTDNALVACSTNCHPVDSNYRRQKIARQQYKMVHPVGIEPTSTALQTAAMTTSAKGA